MDRRRRAPGEHQNRLEHTRRTGAPRQDLIMRHVSTLRAAVPVAIVLGVVCRSMAAHPAPFPALPVHGESGPAVEGERRPYTRGDAARGREVYRYETLGNEGFWTDALRLPQGIIAERITPLGLLELGMHINIERVEEGLRKDITAQFKTDLSKEKAPLLHDPEVTIKLIEVNAVIGFAAKDVDGDGKIDLRGKDKMGITCALCHTVADGSVYQMPGNRGAVGKSLDGLGTYSLDVGSISAAGLNSRAHYPNFQLELGGQTIGRAPRGIRRDSSEAEVDAFLRNKDYYPRGTFDETNDGEGNAVQTTPLFRQDLADPYGTAAELERLEDLSNAAYTQNFDPTSLVTPPGRTFLPIRAGRHGNEMVETQEELVAVTGVVGYAFVQVPVTGLLLGRSPSARGRRVDAGALADMARYLPDLPLPQGGDVDPGAAARGKEV